MPALTGRTIGTPDNTYQGLLHLETPISGAMQVVEDGLGNDTPLQMSTSAVYLTENLGLGTSTPTELLDVRGGRALFDRTAVLAIGNPLQYSFSITNYNTDLGVNYCEMTFGVATDGALIQTFGGQPLWLNRTGNVVKIGGSGLTIATPLGIASGGTSGATALAAATAILGALSHTSGDTLYIAGGVPYWDEPSGGPGGGGTVDSVDMTVPDDIFSVSGGPITTSGVLAITLDVQAANTVLCGPTIGSPAEPAFRALAVSDIPDLSSTYQPLDADLTAIAALGTTGIARRTGANTWSLGTTVAITEGGTGETTAGAARLALLPAIATHTLKVLRVNAGETDVEWATAGGGSPGGSDTHIQFNNAGSFGGSADLTWNGTTLTLGASKNLSAGGYIAGSNLNQFTAFTGPTTTTKTFTLPDASCTILTTNAAVTIGQGGTGQTTATAAFDALSPMTTLGDVIYGGTAGTGTRLAGNTTVNIKTLAQTGTGAVSAAPVWTAVVTAIASAGSSLTSTPTLTTGSYDLSINLGNSNTWTVAQTFSAGAAGTTPLIVKAHASQSVNLFEIQNSSGVALCHADSAGNMFPMPIMFNLAVGVAGTTGTKMTVMIVMPLAGKIVKAWIIADTAPTGADYIVDINKGDGTTQTSIWNATQANRLKLVATNKTGNQTSFDTTTFAAGDVFSIDVDQIGSTIAGQDIGVVLYCEVRNG